MSKNGKRLTSGWLENYIEMTRETESPDIFHLWCAISTIAGALGRKVWIDRGFYKLYPNLYVVLMGASAIVRKGTAIGIVEHLLREAAPDMNFIAQKITPEALIASISTQYSKTKVSDAYIYAEELAVFLGATFKDANMIALLTKMYNSPTIMDYHTIARGKQTCNNICCNILAGTTPEWIKDALPSSAIAGGFTGRIIFVYQPYIDKKVPFPHVTEKEIKLEQELTYDLKIIHTLKGEYTLTQEATDWFEDWYITVFRPEESDPLLQGYFGRKHDTLLKMAMIQAASQRNQLKVTEDDLEISLKMLNTNESKLSETMKLLMTTQVGSEVRRVRGIIARRGKISHSNLLRSVTHFANAQQVSEILKTLVDSEEIKEVVVDGKRYYVNIRKGG